MAENTTGNCRPETRGSLTPTERSGTAPIRNVRPFRPYRFSCLIVSGLAVATLGACAGPNTKSIANFGETTGKAVAIMDDAGAVQASLRLETAIHHQACQYLQPSTQYALGMPASGPVLGLIAERARFRSASEADTGSLAEPQPFSRATGRPLTQ